MDEDRQQQAREDDRLMERLARDDQSALAELMERWQRPIFRFVYRQLGESEAAEELTQEAFWRIWRARAAYRPEGKFSAFLFRTAARLCMDHYRRRPRRPIQDSERALEVAPAAIGFSADDAACEHQLAEALERALAGLPEKQRLALQLGRFEGRNYQEIAEILECSVGAVEQLIFRARARLRLALADFLPPTDAPPARTRKHPAPGALSMSGKDRRDGKARS